MYQFTEDCMTGIEQIDEEHRYLFELINDAADLLHNEIVSDKYNQIKDLLEQLQEYADTHFEHEEAYMESTNDPELLLQKQQHAAFREKMNIMVVTSLEEDEQQEKALEELLEYLIRWLYRHILSSDIMIGKMQPIRQWKEAKEPCTFSDRFLTGIDLVDREHKILFEIIGEAAQLMKTDTLYDKYDEIVDILDKLKTYTEEHFKDEEEYMEKIGYSRLESQRTAHIAFVDRLSTINLDEVDENQQEYLENLLDFLFSWLTNHILHADKLIGEEAREKNFEER